MHKALISAIVIALIAFPMSVQAGPSKMDAEKSTVDKPLSTMKSTIASPPKSDPASSKILEPATKASGRTDAVEVKSNPTRKFLEDIVKFGKKKGADLKK